MTQLHPCLVAQLIRVWSCMPKGWFHSQGHTWVFVWSPVGQPARQKSTNCTCKGLFLHCQLYSINLYVYSCSSTTLLKIIIVAFIISFKINLKKGWVLQLCSFIQNCFGDLGHLNFHINFKITLLISAKTVVGILNL